MAVVFLVLVLGLCVMVGAGGALFWSLHHAQGSSSRTVRFHVGSGDTVTTVASRLQQAGLITNPLLFRLDAKLHGLGNNLKVGDYRLRPNMSIDQMTAALMVYHSATVQIVIPEGYRAEQIASILDHHGISGRQFLQAVRHPAVHYSILSDKPPQSGLEGYLFPNTYDVAPHSSGSQFAYLMVKTLDQKFTPAMRAQIARQRRSVYQVITLASIVEREAKVPSERPTIASVYMNRLHLHMILNADPTIQYAVGTPQDWWPVLTLEQLRVTSPYNTYIHAGLPPTPICNPGLASIRAAIKPANTNFLYFVAKGNGHHAFAQTYAQQQANIAKYQHQ
jgi:UPF0755 protein